MVKQKIALIGKSASGKDTVKNLLVKAGWRPEVSYTTRPPRDGEVPGIAYHFVTEEQFHQVEMLEKVCFNGWWYGTGKDAYYAADVHVFTPKGLALLPEECKQNLLVAYLIVNETVQRQRIKNRGDKDDSVDRRIAADYEDFKDFEEWNLTFNTEIMTAEEIADALVNFKLEDINKADSIKISGS